MEHNVISVEDLECTFHDKENDEINKMIAKFVNEMDKKGQSASYYRENRNATRTSDNLALGKKAEFFALKIMTDYYGFPMVKPDLEIRVGKTKGWQIDLPFREYDSSFPNVHVKSCDLWTYDYVGDFSWTFQYANKDGSLGRDNIFKSYTSDDLIALVFLETHLSKSGIVKAVLPWTTISKYFKNPKKESLRGIKLVVDYKDLIADKGKLVA